MPGFADRLRRGPPLVADGGMGVLVSAAVPGLRCPEEANLRAPDAVVAVHVSFVNAGADVIETNSFGANRHKLAQHFLEDDFEKINSAAVKLARDAREVTGRDVFIAGSIGPLGDIELREQGHVELFAEQARILEGRGADLFMLETFYDLHELELAIEAVRSVSKLPVVALMSFDSEGQTLAGVKARDAAERARALGVDAFGANHGRGPAAALTALAEMGDGLPLAALPNVGLASMAGNRVAFPHATPDYFAEFAARARALGAQLIGGCCGTTPAQIAAIREAVDAGRAASAPTRARLREEPLEARPAEQPTQLAEKLAAGEFVVSVQLDPPLGASIEGLCEAAAEIRASGLAHFVDVNDNPRARARMSGVIASSAIQQAAGIETIPHLTPRDQTISGLESTLLGAHAVGLRNMLAVTGDPPEAGDYPGTGSVYDVDAIGLVELIARLNDGLDFHGRAIDAPTSFFPGVAVNPTADDLELEADRFRRKVDAGARFAMTQILFDLTYLESFLERIGGSPVPLMVGVWPIRSLELAVRVHNETPGIVVPDQVQARYRDAGADAAKVGVELARELVAGARELAAGVYVMAPFRRPLGVLDLLSSL
ncbi:MAG TPA: bifunctional homocysteine S-methyltransferase/methylenetetrahydrofolate reductase [Gaiellaceae bacterium]|nr:bifunctional homocysteine S-methyltransferase/methylenetetrahydrofolate reductase [Gaiellaceae bacterium]